MKKLNFYLLIAVFSSIIIGWVLFSDKSEARNEPPLKADANYREAKQVADSPAALPEAADNEPVAVVKKGSALKKTASVSIRSHEVADSDTDEVSLKDKLLQKGVYFGTALNPADIQLRAPRPKNYLDEISRYFNFYTISVTFKTTENQRGVFTFQAADKMVEFALAHHSKIKGHVLAWGDALPDWVTQGNYSPDELKSILQNHVQTIVKHFKDKYPGAVTEWNVVNEPVCNDAAFNNQTDCYPEGVKKFVWSAIHKPGSTDPTDYIQYAFEWAHAIDPSAKLFLNENNIETSGNPPKLGRLYNLVKSLKQKGVPINGIGFESHIRLFDLNKFNAQTLTKTMNMFADLGLETQISEFDAVMASGLTNTRPAGLIPITNPTATDFKNQAKLYRIFLTACLHAKNCTGFTTWGVWDNTSWTSTYWKGSFYPHLLDANFKPKLSFKSLMDEAKSYKTEKAF